MDASDRGGAGPQVVKNGDRNPEPERAVKKMRRETWKKAHRRAHRNLEEFGKIKDQGALQPVASAHTRDPFLSTVPSKCNWSAASSRDPSLIGPTLYWGNSWDLGPGATPQFTAHQCPRQSSRTFCSRLCKISTLPQLWQDGLPPSIAGGQSRKGVPSGL